MKQLAIILLLISTLNAAFTKFKNDDYQLLIGGNFNDEALDIVEDYDYNISIIGYSQKFKTKPAPSNSYTNIFSYLESIKTTVLGEQIEITKLNPAGEKVQKTLLPLDGGEVGTTIIKRADNGYIIGGSTVYGKMFVANISSLGNLYNIKKFNNSSFSNVRQIVSYKSGNYFAVGTTLTSYTQNIDIFNQGIGADDIYLIKFNQNGTVSWSKKYGSVNNEEGISVAPTNDGGAIFIGTTEKNSHSKLVAYKVDSRGDIVWKQTFPKSGEQKAFKIVHYTKDTFLISATFKNKNSQENIRLIKIDNEGNVLWTQGYFKNAKEHLNDICIDLKGNIIGVGSSQKHTQSDTDALVRYYNGNGKMIWERRFGKDKIESFKAVALLRNNSFAIAGFSTSYAEKGRQIWIIKLNSAGTLVKKDKKILNRTKKAKK